MNHAPTILLSAGLLAPSFASTQTLPVPPPREAAAQETISVLGVGNVTVTPDRALFTVGVQTVAPAVAIAVQENNARVAAIIDALKKLGATDRDIRTSHLALYPQQEHQEGRRVPRIVGYQVSNSLTVTRDNPAEVGRLLQAAVDAGANTVSGVTFTVSDPARGRDQALQAAFADARAKADTLAKAAGRSVGRVVAVTEGGAVTPPVPMPRIAMMESRAADMPVQPGAEELAFAISVIFEMR